MPAQYKTTGEGIYAETQSMADADAYAKITYCTRWEYPFWVPGLISKRWKACDDVGLCDFRKGVLSTVSQSLEPA